MGIDDVDENHEGAELYRLGDLSEEPVRDHVLTIDCDTCIMKGTDACADCVVSFICSAEPDEAIVVDVAEIRALRMLGDAGLVPHLRHRRRTG